MAKTKALALTTTPLPIVPTDWCDQIVIKEDESVVGWPTTNLIIKKPDQNADPDTITAGKQILFPPRPQGKQYAPGVIYGYVYLPANTTSGIQNES